jgi:hypothetical protein
LSFGFGALAETKSQKKTKKTTHLPAFFVWQFFVGEAQVLFENIFVVV